MGEMRCCVCFCAGGVTYLDVGLLVVRGAHGVVSVTLLSLTMQVVVFLLLMLLLLLLRAPAEEALKHTSISGSL